MPDFESAFGWDKKSYKCPECDCGYTSLDEGNRRVNHACYKCGTTGLLTRVAVEQARFDTLASMIGWNLARQQQASMNSREDGEGFDFCAAENGMNTSDFLNEIHYQQARLFVEQMENVSAVVVSALCDAAGVDTPQEYKPRKKSVPPSPPPSDDVIPF